MAEFDSNIEDMEFTACCQVFRFGGIDKKYESKLLIELPLIVMSNKGKEEVLTVKVYIIDADVTFLIGRATLKK